MRKFGRWRKLRDEIGNENILCKMEKMAREEIR
jgi:hypothetical protein